MEQTPCYLYYYENKKVSGSQFVIESPKHYWTDLTKMSLKAGWYTMV